MARETGSALAEQCKARRFYLIAFEIAPPSLVASAIAGVRQRLEYGGIVLPPQSTSAAKLN